MLDKNLKIVWAKWASGTPQYLTSVKAKQCRENPPIFKKLLAAGSVEEEALNLLIHEKKIMEMELELQQMLNMRFGFGTWDELKEMQRKIRSDREKEVYASAEARQAMINGSRYYSLLVVLGVFVVWRILLYSKGKRNDLNCYMNTKILSM